MSPLLVALTIAACLSPLLTFAHLWQIKEWRIDRLKEHIRSEGVIRQIFRLIRPLLTLHQPFPVWTKKAFTLFTTSLLFTIALAFFILNFTFYILLIVLPLLQPVILFLSWLLWFPVDGMLKRHILDEAKARRSEYPDLTVIGITGSVGKTTTKELLAHILADFHPLVTPAYVNTEMGVANWLIQTLKSPITNHQSPNNTQSPMSNTKIFIVEMGAYRKGEIRTLCEIVQPTIGVITAIGTQHLGLFGSHEAIAQAKGELFQALPKNSHAFIPEDTPFIEHILPHTSCTVHRIPPATRSSIALASAVATHLGMSPEKIDQKIQTFTPPPHTFAIREDSGVTILDDTHNVSPESLHAALDWAASQPQKHKVLITPGIIELGREEKAIHQRLGEKASPVFNRVIFLNKRYANMFQKGYGKPMNNSSPPLPDPLPAGEGNIVEIYSKHSTTVPIGSLLVCIGRMSDKTIRTLLP